MKNVNPRMLRISAVAVAAIGTFIIFQNASVLKTITSQFKQPTVIQQKAFESPCFNEVTFFGASNFPNSPPNSVIMGKFFLIYGEASTQVKVAISGIITFSNLDCSNVPGSNSSDITNYQLSNTGAGINFNSLSALTAASNWQQISQINLGAVPLSMVNSNTESNAYIVSFGNNNGEVLTIVGPNNNIVFMQPLPGNLNYTPANWASIFAPNGVINPGNWSSQIFPGSSVNYITSFLSFVDQYINNYPAAPAYAATAPNDPAIFLQALPSGDFNL